MILTGSEIIKEIELGNIIIDPFKKENIEPNSYGFRLDNKFIEYDEGQVVDSKKEMCGRKFIIEEKGYELQPDKFYLSNTYERMGSFKHAKELYARFSVSSMGMWIQLSAPLGHTGAVIPWTLEIKVTQPVRVYPYMLVGKIGFWDNHGKIQKYKGKYIYSKKVQESLSFVDFNKN